MTLKKPASIAASPFKSAKWDELTSGRNFAQSDVPALELLCQWHAIAAQCIDDIDDGGSVRVAYMNELGDLRAMPQLSTMKQASAEIRALNKQLGINDAATDETPQKKGAMLYVIQGNREKRKANAARAN